MALTLASTAFAQTTLTLVIGVGAHGVNHMVLLTVVLTKFLTTSIKFSRLTTILFTPPLSKLTITRNLNKYFVLDWQTSVEILIIKDLNG